MSVRKVLLGVSLEFFDDEGMAIGFCDKLNALPSHASDPLTPLSTPYGFLVHNGITIRDAFGAFVPEHVKPLLFQE